MSSANTLPSDFSARLDEQSDWLAALPVLAGLPLGRWYANFLLARLIRSQRKTVQSMTEVLMSGEFARWLPEDRKQWAAHRSQEVEACRRGLAKIGSLEHRGILLRPLVARFAKVIDDFSDLAETFALGVDPEVNRLAQELSDVL